MSVTYDVRVYKTEIYRGKTRKTYTVRWKVDGKIRRNPMLSAALADSFRSELTTAMRRGEAFNSESGLPLSLEAAARNAVSWYDVATQFVDLKWGNVSPRYREDIARALVAATPAMYAAPPVHSDKDLRHVMNHYAFNFKQRERIPADKAAILAWLTRNTKSISSLADDPALTRSLFDHATSKLDGKRAAPDTVKKHRMLINGVLDYAVELGVLERNPSRTIKFGKVTANVEVDSRSVINHDQAKKLLNAVGEREPSGPRLKAFFALMYYAALRPEEALNITPENLSMPPDRNGWGRITLWEVDSKAGASWTDNGESRVKRPLKQRPVGHERRVPMSPQLAEYLREHIEHFVDLPADLLFRGVHGGLLPHSTYRKAWREARKIALTPEQVLSPLAKKPYDLRHACVSTWLSAGVPPTQVAEWAGHSVDVLLRIYAKSVFGDDVRSLERINQALEE